MIAVAALAALAIDAAFGEPDRLWRRVPHPVVLMGQGIGALDRSLNQGSHRRVKGVVALGLALAAAVVPATICQTAIHAAFGEGVVAALVLGALAASLIAHNSLHQHVAAVGDARTLEDARSAVSLIVGRETATLDDAGVSSAALETLSESLSDGVVAPLVFFLIGGLPGIVAYKVINTADSMIGHRTPRHEAFGWAAARTDDLANLVPARLTALLTLVAAPRLVRAAGSLARDAKAHVSPNAGWPEAAFAHALAVALGGPRRYGDRVVDGHTLNAGARPPARSDIRAGLTLSRRVGLIQFALVAILAAATR